MLMVENSPNNKPAASKAHSPLWPLIVLGCIGAATVLSLFLLRLFVFTAQNADKEAKTDLAYIESSVKNYYAKNGVLPTKEDLLSADSKNSDKYTSLGENKLYLVLRVLSGGVLSYEYEYFDANGQSFVPDGMPNTYYLDGVKHENNIPARPRSDIAKITVTYVERDPVGECDDCFRDEISKIEVSR